MRIILGMMLIILFSCKGREVSTKNLHKQEILSLITDESRQKYLEQILIDDQKVRGSKGQELMLKYGKDSKEHMAYYREQWRQDSINLIKIEQYLKIHGYPKNNLGNRATTTPWMVIHHSLGYDTRENNFEIIYKAYLEGDIDDGALSFYLGRMYQMKNGERHEMKSPYKSEDEINQLIIALGLEELKLKVNNGLELN